MSYKVRRIETSILIYYFYGSDFLVTDLEGYILNEEYEQFKTWIKRGKYKDVINHD